MNFHPVVLLREDLMLAMAKMKVTHFIMSWNMRHEGVYLQPRTEEQLLTLKGMKASTIRFGDPHCNGLFSSCFVLVLLPIS